MDGRGGGLTLLVILLISQVFWAGCASTMPSSRSKEPQGPVRVSGDITMTAVSR